MGTTTETFDTKQLVEIFRLCVTQQENTSAKEKFASGHSADRERRATDDNQSDGFMIWLEPE